MGVLQDGPIGTNLFSGRTANLWYHLAM